jgi:hypothetical protein
VEAETRPALISLGSDILFVVLFCLPITVNIIFSTVVGKPYI